MNPTYSRTLNGSTNGTITSGNNLSSWFSPAAPTIAFEKLSRDITTDILVIGGGIAGLTTAYCLAKAGRTVVLVEDGYIGSGETGRTTAHLTCALDDRYFTLEKMFDENTAKLAADSHRAAIEWIAETVQRHAIECNFKRVDGYLFLHPSDSIETLEKEYAATHRAGIATELLHSMPSVSSETAPHCLKFPHQAQFHILQYLKGLANAFVELGGTIYTQTKVEKFTTPSAKTHPTTNGHSETAHSETVQTETTQNVTANGYSISANSIVVATNSPINDLVVMHTKQWAYRTYVIAGKVPKGSVEHALWWDTGDHNSRWISQPYHYVRVAECDEQYDLIIAGGEDHRTGQAGDEDIYEEDRYDALIAWTKQHFPQMEAIEYKWSGQVMEPLDSLAYIGKNPGDSNIFIITGDSGNGMTHGTLGGMIITDIIAGNDNPWIELYNPSRISLKTTADYLHEIGTMVAQYSDWFATPQAIHTIAGLQCGEGGIISSGLSKIAVYRNASGTLHTCTAVCPHQHGILHWNADEHTFDCPLHGSRFTGEGIVVNGPAISNLKKVVLSEQTLNNETNDRQVDALAFTTRGAVPATQ
jgi:glycine/D-amino acid oxidase-like deaminating enzyme/nitrite reductase/ring-hydroxylating ferredoxin subunit